MFFLFSGRWLAFVPGYAAWPVSDPDLEVKATWGSAGRLIVKPKDWGARGVVPGCGSLQLSHIFAAERAAMRAPVFAVFEMELFCGVSLCWLVCIHFHEGLLRRSRSNTCFADSCIFCNSVCSVSTRGGGGGIFFSNPPDHPPPPCPPNHLSSFSGFFAALGFSHKPLIKHLLQRFPHLL